jgi:crotonobetainyl-CoA:carnitine CoA-transferase CaiB-like acyl-CoA transferase
MGGLMHRAGAAHKPPVVAPGALAYDAAGVTAAFATLLAYWKRLQTGRGQHVDVSVLESVANLSDWALPGFSTSGQAGGRSGAGIYTLYRCADGWIRMIVLVKHHWRALLDWIGNPEELADPALDEFLGRLRNMDLIVRTVEGFFRDKKKVDVAREAQRRGIPATPLLMPSEVLANEHVMARGTFRRYDVGGGFEADLPAGLLEVDGERAAPRAGPPALGGDGEPAFAPRAVAVPGSPPPAPDGRPLRGIRVLDFGVGGVGVEVGRLLAEYGAEVIKVESRTAPDFIRTIMGGTMNPAFASSSRSKLGFGANLKTEEGRELVRHLVPLVDVVIENNGSGVMERLGLGPEQLRERNPRIVSFSSQMVGSRGPWKDWIGYGPSTHPVSGLQYLWNYPEDEDTPAGSTNIHPDHLVGRVGALAVMAGLIGRLRRGRGMHADAAQFESAHRGAATRAGVRTRGASSACAATTSGGPCAKRSATRRGPGRTRSPAQRVAGRGGPRSTRASPSGPESAALARRRRRCRRGGCRRASSPTEDITSRIGSSRRAATCSASSSRAWAPWSWRGRPSGAATCPGRSWLRLPSSGSTRAASPASCSASTMRRSRGWSRRACSRSRRRARSRVRSS